MGRTVSHRPEWPPHLNASQLTDPILLTTVAKAFVVTMGDYLRANIFDATEAQPKTNGSIAPIKNDLRSSPDASPYKDHLMFRFWEGPVKQRHGRSSTLPVV